MKADHFYNLFSRALEIRHALFNVKDSDCFRLFNASGDGFDGITADYYSGYVLLQYFSKRAEENIGLVREGAMAAYRDIPGGIKALLVKNRLNIDDSDYNNARKSIVVHGNYPEDGIVVVQNGVKARTDLVNGQSTGIFLDMREIRNRLPAFYQENNIESMLNLFSYTCLFSVHALLNNLSSAINVDLSKGVLARGRENYRLNGLPSDDRDFIYGDALEWIRFFFKKERVFDFAVFDPPTFARNRKKQFSVKRDYGKSLEVLDKIIRPGGLIFTSVNSYSVSEDEYREFHPGSWELLMFGNESSDFVNSSNPYLKAGLWKK